MRASICRWTRRLTRVAIDVSGRPYLVWNVDFSQPKIGDFDTELVREWFQAFAMNAGVTLACRNALRRQQSPYCRKLLQGSGARLARRRSRSIRARRTASLDQRIVRRLMRAVDRPCKSHGPSRVERRSSFRAGRLHLVGFSLSAALAASIKGMWIVLLVALGVADRHLALADALWVSASSCGIVLAFAINLIIGFRGQRSLSLDLERRGFTRA